MSDEVALLRELVGIQRETLAVQRGPRSVACCASCTYRSRRNSRGPRQDARLRASVARETCTGNRPIDQTHFCEHIEESDLVFPEGGLRGSD
jgi:hypothetical protein